MRYKKSAVSSAQIVQAAIRVLARQGYARTSLMDIAREAGMSKGAVHYHFPTKESLIEVVLKTATDVVQQRTIDAWNSGGDDTLLSLHNSLEELWKTRAERSDEALVVADLLAQSLYDDKLQPHLAEFYKLAAEQTHEYLSKEFERHGIKPNVPMKILPRLVVGLLDGLVMQAFVDPDVFDPDEIVTAIEMLGIAMFNVPPRDKR